MRQRIVAYLRRPEFWLAGLWLWLLGSAGRSLGTPWERVALTEALRWSAGIGLMLALGRCRRGWGHGAKLAVVLVGLLSLLGVTDGTRLDQGGMVGPYHDHQLYGSALLVLLPLTAVLPLTARQNSWRLGGLAVLSAGILCLVLSQTRSAWMGGLTAAVVFGGLWLRRTQPPVRQGRTLAVSAAVLFVGLAAVWMLVDTASQRARVADRAATLETLGHDGSWQARLTTWRGAEHLIEASPVIGIGLGRYPTVQQAWTHVGRSLGTEMRPSLSEEAHNFYLQTVAEIGIVGLSLYLAALTAYAALGVRRLRTSRQGPPRSGEVMVIATLSALAGQAVDALASPSWQFAETSLFFWAMLGMGWAAMRRNEPLPEPTFLPTSRRLFSPRFFSPRFFSPRFFSPRFFSPRFFSPQVAVGMAFVALTAEILPVGLLTPVEAYTHTSNITFQSAAIQQITTNCPTGSYCFSMTAKYSNGSSQDVTFDNGTPLAASFSCLRVSTHATCVGKFGTGTSRNQIIPSTSDQSYTLQINGSFSDNGSIKSASSANLSP